MIQPERIIISESQKRRAIPKGSIQFFYTEEVIYKSPGLSITKHEISQKQKRKIKRD